MMIAMVIVATASEAKGDAVRPTVVAVAGIGVNYAGRLVISGLLVVIISRPLVVVVMMVAVMAVVVPIIMRLCGGGADYPGQSDRSGD